MYVRALLVSCVLSLFVCFPAFADMVPTPSDASEPGPGYMESSEFEGDGPAAVMEVYALNDAPAALSMSDDTFVNCVRYDVTISGTEYVLLLPSAYESSIMVDSDGYLWNMSASSITGRLFVGTFSPTADTGLLLTLAPCLGNNFQANHSYGSPNYIRSYYWSGTNGNSLSYTTQYVLVQVDRSYHLYDSGHLLEYVMIFLTACCLICLWKRSGR